MRSIQQIKAGSIEEQVIIAAAEKDRDAKFGRKVRELLNATTNSVGETILDCMMDGPPIVQEVVMKIGDLLDGKEG